jgi:hypothetical protein
MAEQQQGLSKSERAELERLRAEVKALREERESGIRVQRSEKGGVSLYLPGRRFPVTFYRDEWDAVAANVEKVLAFISGNAEGLITKAEATERDRKERTKKNGGK